MPAPITSTAQLIPGNRHPAFTDDTYFDDSSTWNDLIDIVFMGDPQNRPNKREAAALRMLRELRSRN